MSIFKYIYMCVFVNLSAIRVDVSPYKGQVYLLYLGRQTARRERNKGRMSQGEGEDKMEGIGKQEELYNEQGKKMKVEHRHHEKRKEMRNERKPCKK
jgi:hypothetical protein